MAGTGRHRVNAALCHRGSHHETQLSTDDLSSYMLSVFSVSLLLSFFLFHLTHPRISVEPLSNRSLTILPFACNNSTAAEWFFIKFRKGKILRKKKLIHFSFIYTGQFQRPFYANSNLRLHFLAVSCVLTCVLCVSFILVTLWTRARVKK